MATTMISPRCVSNSPSKPPRTCSRMPRNPWCRGPWWPPTMSDEASIITAMVPKKAPATPPYMAPRSRGPARETARQSTAPPTSTTATAIATHECMRDPLVVRLTGERQKHGEPDEDGKAPEVVTAARWGPAHEPVHEQRHRKHEDDEGLDVDDLADRERDRVEDEADRIAEYCDHPDRIAQQPKQPLALASPPLCSLALRCCTTMLVP